MLREKLWCEIGVEFLDDDVGGDEFDFVGLLVVVEVIVVVTLAWRSTFCWVRLGLSC